MTIDDDRRRTIDDRRRTIDENGVISSMGGSSVECTALPTWKGWPVRIISTLTYYIVDCTEPIKMVAISCARM